MNWEQLDGEESFKASSFVLLSFPLVQTEARFFQLSFRRCIHSIPLYIDPWKKIHPGKVETCYTVINLVLVAKHLKDDLKMPLIESATILDFFFFLAQTSLLIAYVPNSYFSLFLSVKVTCKTITIDENHGYGRPKKSIHCGVASWFVEVWNFFTAKKFQNIFKKIRILKNA